MCEEFFFDSNIKLGEYWEKNQYPTKTSPKSIDFGVLPWY
jgi:hypothetical protein